MTTPSCERRAFAEWLAADWRTYAEMKDFLHVEERTVYDWMCWIRRNMGYTIHSKGVLCRPRKYKAVKVSE